MQEKEMKKQETKKEYRRPELTKRQRLVEITEGIEPGNGAVTP